MVTDHHKAKSPVKLGHWTDALKVKVCTQI